MTNPEGNWVMVAALGSALSRSENNLSAIPGLILQVLEGELWREFVTPLGHHVHYDHIDDFVLAPPADGLGVEPKFVEKLIEGDMRAYDMFTATRRRPQGHPRKSDQREPPVRKDNNVILSSKVPGNAAAQALRRLRKDAPKIHDKVLAGELSPNAGMVEAGLRPRTLTIRPEDPDYTARALRRQMAPEDLATLILLLVDEQEA